MKYLLHGYPFAGTEVHASREQKKQWTLFSWSLDSSKGDTYQQANSLLVLAQRTLKVSNI